MQGVRLGRSSLEKKRSGCRPAERGCKRVWRCGRECQQEQPQGPLHPPKLADGAAAQPRHPQGADVSPLRRGAGDPQLTRPPARLGRRRRRFERCQRSGDKQEPLALPGRTQGCWRRQCPVLNRASICGGNPPLSTVSVSPLVVRMPTHSAAGSHQAGINSERGQARGREAPVHTLLDGSGPAITSKGELGLAFPSGLGLRGCRLADVL